MANDPQVHVDGTPFGGHAGTRFDVGICHSF
jgi:hypothetical protein